jgi:hypothetical protein
VRPHPQSRAFTQRSIFVHFCFWKPKINTALPRHRPLAFLAICHPHCLCPFAGCKVTFRNMSELQRHVRVHTGTLHPRSLASSINTFVRSCAPVASFVFGPILQPSTFIHNVQIVCFASRMWYCLCAVVRRLILEKAGNSHPGNTTRALPLTRSSSCGCSVYLWTFGPQANGRSSATGARRGLHGERASPDTKRST